MSGPATCIVRPEPIEALREASDAAAIRGLAVAPGGYGVRLVRVLGVQRWIPEPGTRYVDPLGALLLERQPLADDADEAAAEALGVTVAFVPGVRMGLERGAPPAPERLPTVEARLAFLHGLEVGTRLRAELLTEVCPAHGTRHRRGEECPRCEVEAVHAGDELPARGAVS